MLWNEVVSNELVVAGVLVLVSQMVFVSKVPKCLESAEMHGGDMPQPIKMIRIHLPGSLYSYCIIGVPYLASGSRVSI